MDPAMTLENGQRVRVHLNLHRGDFSVIDPRSNLLLTNVSDITLGDVTFRVQPGMLNKIRRINRRKVCAYAVGLVLSMDAGWTTDDCAGKRRVTFNPYRADTFTDDTGQSIHQADAVRFTDRYGWIL